MTLTQFFQENPRVALAFSGGVDSAYLLYAAVQAGAQVHAYYVKSPFQPAFELDDARRLADQLQAQLTVLELDVLCDPVIAANPADRCYHCKRRILTAILEAARADGYPVLMDGNNASDQIADRPGMRAVQELCVRSPLREAGLTKKEIRELSKAAELFTFNKPAYACLATRIPTGTALTAENLARTEWAEMLLMDMGFRNFRIRTFDDCARIQVVQSQLFMLANHQEEILQKLRTRYRGVMLDLEVRCDE